jgi:hypothetical protein
MKKVFRILTLFVAIASMAAITSCSKDKASLIVGKWQYEKATIDLSIDDPEMQEYFDQIVAEEENAMNEAMKDEVIEFKADNTYMTYYKDEPEEPGQYSIDGDKLIMDDETFTIKSLTKSKLVLEIVETFTEEEDDFNGTISSTLELKRI